MTKYALTVYSTLEALEAAVEAIDNDVAKKLRWGKMKCFYTGG